MKNNLDSDGACFGMGQSTEDAEYIPLPTTSQLDAELEEIKATLGTGLDHVSSPRAKESALYATGRRLLEIVEQQQQEIERLKVGCEKYLDELNFERGLWDKSEVEYQAESQQLRERVKELEVALRGLFDMLGHTIDCPASTQQAKVLGYLTSIPQPCSEPCKAARTALARKGE